MTIATLARCLVCSLALLREGTAGEEVARLSPAVFAELPVNVVAALERRGCTIPQHAESSRRANVIKGEFARPGQTDWVVLCSRAGHLETIVFWNGLAAKMEIVFSLQVPDPLRSPFETEIAPVSRDYILDHCRAGGVEPPPIDHQGIETSTGMSSGIQYFYRGKWLLLPGAD
jgi:hypothetical protein